MIRQFERAIDPEKLRAWALDYLKSVDSLTNQPISLPAQIAGMVKACGPVGDELNEPGSQCVGLWLQLGGFAFNERILVGPTNVTMKPSRYANGIRIRWRDGMYYAWDSQ